jgi:hypothetical protein
MRYTRTIAAGLAAAFTLSGCAGFSSLDVVGKQSVASFSEVLQIIPDKVQPDVLNAGWALSAPDDSARFIWSEDFSIAPMHDVMIEFDAQPFLDAGLTPENLPEEYFLIQGMDGMSNTTIMVGKKLGSDKPEGTSQSAIAAYEQIVNKYRDEINFHTSLDHFGVKLGGGNMFEWAKNLKTNGFDESAQDKDIVFVLNPAPFIEAGVDPEKVTGWAYAQVSVEENGVTADVWKFLKPFDLA